MCVRFLKMNLSEFAKPKYLYQLYPTEPQKKIMYPSNQVNVNTIHVAPSRNPSPKRHLTEF